MSEYDMLFKVLLVGDEETGKTGLLMRFVEDSFPETYISTIGVDFRVKTTTCKGKTIKLQIWDTAGQERFRTITSSYYRGSQGVMIVFDVTDRSTFRRVEGWVTDVERYTSENVVKLLVGNKCDEDDKRCVTEEEAKSLALINNMEYTDVSGKNNINVKEAFDMLIEEMFENTSQQHDAQNVPKNLAPMDAPEPIIQKSKKEEKSANIGDDDAPEWAKLIVSELCKMEEKINLLDNIKNSVDTLNKKVEVLEKKVNRLETSN